MKTLPSLAFLAAFVAFVFLPLPFEIVGSILLIAALAAIAVSDYTRAQQPLPLAAAPAAPVTARRRLERGEHRRFHRARRTRAAGTR